VVRILATRTSVENRSAEEETDEDLLFSSNRKSAYGKTLFIYFLYSIFFHYGGDFLEDLSSS